ncbi:MAG: hypothetical protein NKF70_06905 [Methanobacterium sp. ERen5]|nr:MAG: hypothetical protein NKF70_06905 [Methanobacterium sp. ERen5]
MSKNYFWAYCSSFFNESEIVTVNMGPGTMAPERPTMNEVAVKRMIPIQTLLNIVITNKNLMNSNFKKQVKAL